MTTLTYEKGKELYVEKEYSLRDIGKLYGKSRHWVWCQLKKLNIDRRKKSVFTSIRKSKQSNSARIKAIGRIMTQETKIKIKKSMVGKNKREKSGLWKGGKSFEKYGDLFNRKLKEKIRIRDHYRCQECFRHQNELNEKLSIHHIDFNKKNNEDNNLISLCRSCHSQTNFNRTDWIDYYQIRMKEGGLN